jgi:hypothetical protein
LLARNRPRFHEDPQVTHYYEPRAIGIVLEPGMTFTIEPMVNSGAPRCASFRRLDRRSRSDHSLSAQWEHTVLVTESGYEVTDAGRGRAPPAEHRGLQRREVDISAGRVPRRRGRFLETLDATLGTGDERVATFAQGAATGDASLKAALQRGERSKVSFGRARMVDASCAGVGQHVMASDVDLVRSADTDAASCIRAPTST